MDQQGQTGGPSPMGPAGRRLHIAHRRSPSELTPLMSTYPVTSVPPLPDRANMYVVEQLALAQQIELLQQQQQQIAATHQQYVNMGMIPQQQQMQNFQQMQGQMQNMSPHGNQFQFPQQMPQQQQHLGVPINAPTQPSAHRRNQSAVPSMGSMGPPPAPAGKFNESSISRFLVLNSTRSRERRATRSRRSSR
jgi:protein SSD1